MFKIFFFFFLIFNFFFGILNPKHRASTLSQIFRSVTKNHFIYFYLPFHNTSNSSIFLATSFKYMYFLILPCLFLSLPLHLSLLRYKAFATTTPTNHTHLLLATTHHNLTTKPRSATTHHHQIQETHHQDPRNPHPKSITTTKPKDKPTPKPTTTKSKKSTTKIQETHTQIQSPPQPKFTKPTEMER